MKYYKLFLGIVENLLAYLGNRPPKSRAVEKLAHRVPRMEAVLERAAVGAGILIFALLLFAVLWASNIL